MSLAEKIEALISEQAALRTKLDAAQRELQNLRTDGIDAHAQGRADERAALAQQAAQAGLFKLCHHLAQHGFLGGGV